MLPNRTRYWAKALRWITWLTMIALIGAAVYASADPQDLIRQAHDGIGKTQGDWPNGPITKALLIAGTWVQFGVALFILWHMAKLFDCYARGDALSASAARHIRGIGLGTLARALVSALYTPYVSLVLSIDAPAGQRSFGVAIDNHMVVLGLLGGLFLMIGMVMAQAVHIARENESFV